jgi:hypothetical protein
MPTNAQFELGKGQLDAFEREWPYEAGHLKRTAIRRTVYGEVTYLKGAQVCQEGEQQEAAAPQKATKWKTSEPKRTVTHRRKALIGSSCLEVALAIEAFAN